MLTAVLSKDHLEHAALIEIQSCEGCEDVQGVEIEPIGDVRSGLNCRVASIHRTARGLTRLSAAERIYTAQAIEAVQKKLSELYSLHRHR